MSSLVACAAGGVLIFGAVAYACTPQASISTNQSSVVAGQTVTGSGLGFSTSPTAGAVQLWWNSTSGSPLWSANPDASGRISFSLPVPASVQPGYYTLVARQGSYTARAPMQVPGQGGGATQSAATASSSEGTVTGDLWSGFRAGEKPSLASDERPSSWAVPAGAALLSLGLVSLSLFAGFLGVAARRRRAGAEVATPPQGGSGIAN